ncbi:hypothetical protein PHMEG_0009895 [Phytophthora megakarya]|uniref:Uncharacterized protein n=1 Tax=Phytophthora megakarya TaxID=4795 RepID=A0A225WGS2_9STRA|nr:hypothetical protein PHMEG_0009895 [Phytophthora megakarya]
MITMNSFTKHRISDIVVEDWRWFKAVLLHNERFNQVPVSRILRRAWVLEPQTREFLRLRCTADELRALKGPDSYFINVRELQSARFYEVHIGKATTGGILLTSVFILATGVLYLGRLGARSPSNRSPIQRLLSLIELHYRIKLSAEHIPGRLNTMADAGSRAWSERNTLWDLWTNVSFSWKQVAVTPPYDNFPIAWEVFSGVTSWPGLQTKNTKATGINGESSLK